MEYVTMKKVESPLSVFNNLIIQLTDKLDEILYPNNKTGINQLRLKNQLIFENDSIMIMNIFKLKLYNNKLHIKVLKPLNAEEFTLLNDLTVNFPVVENCFFQYLMLYNKIAANCDDIPFQLVNSIVELVEKAPNNLCEYYLIPFKSKIKHLYEKESDKSLMTKIFNRYSYCISFYKTSQSRITFSYKIYRVLSSELDESKCLDNINFLEEDCIRKDTLPLAQLRYFVEQLFYYGEIITGSQTYSSAQRNS